MNRDTWNKKLKRIAAIEGMKELPSLPKSRGYTVLYNKGLTPVQALARIIKAFQPKGILDFMDAVNKLAKPFIVSIKKSKGKKITFIVRLDPKYEELATIGQLKPMFKLEQIITDKAKKYLMSDPIFKKGVADFSFKPSKK